jgi:hypothetical protein
LNGRHLLLVYSDDTVAYRPFVRQSPHETTAVATQQRDKHASTTKELLLETVLCNTFLGSCNSWTTAMETGEFSMWSVSKSYLEDSWGDSAESQPVNR